MTTKETIDLELEIVEQFIAAHESNQNLINAVFQHITDNQELFTRIELLRKEVPLDISFLNFIALIIDGTYRSMRELGIHQFNSKFTFKENSLQNLKRKVVAELRKFVDPTGVVDYLAHPELASIYDNILKIEKELRNTIQNIAKSSIYEDALQYLEHDIINDSFVLAVRADRYNGNHGPIVARSNSGNTFFVTPLAIKDKIQKRIILLSELEAKLQKIVNGFSAVIYQNVDAIITAKNYLLTLDITNAKALFSKHNDLVRPEIVDAYVIELEDFFHPLIEYPVKNSVTLNSVTKGLIISGPNTGGKTVCMKTITLIHLFAHFGILVPARKAKISALNFISYMGNDLQDLSQNLSSFAAETKHYLELLNNLNDKSLIVIDEIFNSTSSEEASALAMGLLEEIHKRTNAKVIISTHHQFLKTFMHDNREYISAHVGHNPENYQPTYKLNVGVPGSSMALFMFDKISKQLNIHNKIQNIAQKYLDQKQVSYEKLLSTLAQRKFELDNLLEKNRSLNHELNNQKRAMEGVLRLEKETLIKEFEGKIKTILKRAQDLLHDVRTKKIDSIKSFQKSSLQISSEFQSEKHQITGAVSKDHTYERFNSIDDLKVNNKVRSLVFNSIVTITSINHKKNEVEVSYRGKILKCHFSDLRKLDNDDVKTNYNKLKQNETIQINIERSETIARPEIDCRGMRLPEFVEEFEFHLNGLYQQEIPYLNVIHGHGDGILKGWLRNYLKDNQSELSWDTPEGNDGSTRILLK